MLLHRDVHFTSLHSMLLHIATPRAELRSERREQRRGRRGHCVLVVLERAAVVRVEAVALGLDVGRARVDRRAHARALEALVARARFGVVGESSAVAISSESSIRRRWRMPV